MLKNFYIFRNGQSSYNLAGKLQGQSNNSVLTDKGINQAFAAAMFLKDKSIDIIVSSPQRRARQTGNIVSKQIKAPIFYDSRFAEVDLGSADGLSLNRLPKKHQTTLQKWQHNSAQPRFQHGESKGELRRRVSDALSDYASGDYQNVAVSSHNFSIMEVLQSLNINKSSVDNGEIIHLQYDGQSWKLVQTAN